MLKVQIWKWLSPSLLRSLMHSWKGKYPNSWYLSDMSSQRIGKKCVFLVEQSKCIIFHWTKHAFNRGTENWNTFTAMAHHQTFKLVLESCIPFWGLMIPVVRFSESEKRAEEVCFNVLGYVSMVYRSSDQLIGWLPPRGGQILQNVKQKIHLLKPSPSKDESWAQAELYKTIPTLKAK